MNSTLMNRPTEVADSVLMVAEKKPKPAVRLTKREIEVLIRVAEGDRNKDVADYLFVSRRTVDFHLANIFDKLMVNNRIQACRAATRLGLIPFDPAYGRAMGQY